MQSNLSLTVEVPVGGQLNVRALTRSHELIEAFEEELHGANARYVYNVAGAAPLLRVDRGLHAGRRRARELGVAREKQLGL